MHPLLFLQYQTFVNRQIRRFKRLKRPKYLIGGVAGALYFYFYFFRLVFGGAHPRHSPFVFSSEHLQLAQSIGASVLLVIVLLAWIIPHGRAALMFSEAEVNFLFPAPISRQTLIHFKLLKSQIGILFTTLLLTLVSRRFGGGGAGWIRALGWWVILSTLNLHFIGSSFARTMLLDRGISNWRRRTLVLLLVAASAVVVAVWARQGGKSLAFPDLWDLPAVKEYFQRVSSSGPAPYLLYPFLLVVRPFFASTATQFATLLVPALLILLAHYFWVIRGNVAFEEASIDLSRRIAERVTAARSGNLQPRPTKARPAPFVLAPRGSPATALLWKNLIAAGQMFNLRIGIILLFSFLPMMLVLASSFGSLNVSYAVGIGSMMVLVWSFMIGPQLLRQDFRHDLPNADVLKTFPMRGWQVVLGELLAPVAVLTGLQWFLITTAAIFLNHLPDFGRVGLGLRLSFALGIAVVMPMLNLVSLIIPNGSVLLYPGWFQTGREGPQGIEATGQRLIYMICQVLVFAVALLPALAVAGFVYWVFYVWGQFLFGIPVASVVFAIILGLEAAIAIGILGRIFDRFDLSTEA
jgi:ABC-2 type transport system permease protein